MSFNLGKLKLFLLSNLSKTGIFGVCKIVFQLRNLFGSLRNALLVVFNRVIGRGDGRGGRLAFVRKK